MHSINVMFFLFSAGSIESTERRRSSIESFRTTKEATQLARSLYYTLTLQIFSIVQREDTSIYYHYLLMFISSNKTDVLWKFSRPKYWV